MLQSLGNLDGCVDFGLNKTSGPVTTTTNHQYLGGMGHIISNLWEPIYGPRTEVCTL